MKNFQNYTPEKYKRADFQKVSDGVYKTKYNSENVFVTSLSFEMEPERYGEEDGSPQYMPQLPIEGIWDEFNLFVTDFYERLNETGAARMDGER